MQCNVVTSLFSNPSSWHRWPANFLATCSVTPVSWAELKGFSKPLCLLNIKILWHKKKHIDSHSFTVPFQKIAKKNRRHMEAPYFRSASEPKAIRTCSAALAACWSPSWHQDSLEVHSIQIPFIQFIHIMNILFLPISSIFIYFIILGCLKKADVLHRKRWT